MRLYVHIPESLPYPDVSCPWVFRDVNGRPLSEGVDPLRMLPAARHVELIAPASRVLLTQVTLPGRSRQRLREMLPFAVEDRITVEPERVHVALGPQLSDGAHALAIVDRDWLTQWVGAFTAAARTPHSMKVETCLAPLEPGAWTVVWRGEDGFVRTGPASGMALDADNAVSAPAVLQLALEEARSMGTGPDRLLVHAAEGAFPPLEAWSDALGLPCEAGPAWDWMRAQHDTQFELLQGEFLPSAPMRALLPRFRPALVLGALIVALQVSGTVIHWAVLRYEKSQLQAEMTAVFKASFPTAQAIVDPALQMRRQLDTLRRAGGESRPDDLLPLLAQVSTAIGRSANNARVRSITYEQARLRIDMELASRADAEAVLSRLQDPRTAATLEAVSPRGANVEARFVVSARGGT